MCNWTLQVHHAHIPRPPSAETNLPEVNLLPKCLVVSIWHNFIYHYTEYNMSQALSAHSTVDNHIDMQPV